MMLKPNNLELIDQQSNLEELEYEFKYDTNESREAYPSPLWQEMRTNKIFVWVIQGSRGSGKTWDVVWNLVEKIREESFIKAVAGRLKADKLKWIRGEFLAVIRYYGYEHEFDMNNQRFLHKISGSEIIFMAIIDEDEVRGLQGVKYFYVDESKDISQSMVETILPSVRMEGGEVYFTFNPEFESDYLYREYVLNWDLEFEQKQILLIQKRSGDSSKNYMLWRNVVTKNIIDVFAHESILSIKLGKEIKLLSNTLRMQYYDAWGRAKHKNDDEAWSNFNHIWCGKCNYNSSGLVYYKQVKEIDKLPNELIFAERSYRDSNENEHTGYFLNGNKLSFLIGADWGETTSDTDIIIMFELEKEIVTPEGGIYFERDLFVVGEVHLSGAECKEALYQVDEFGSKLYHKIFHSIKNHKNKLCRDIYKNNLQIIGDFSPRGFNISLKGLGLNVKDCIKSHDSVQKKNFVDDNIDKIKQRYTTIYILKNQCPNLLKDIRSFRREMVESTNDKGQVETIYEYKGSKHTMDAFRYGLQPILYGKKNKEYISPRQLEKKLHNQSLPKQNLTVWQRSAKNITLNSRNKYKI